MPIARHRPSVTIAPRAYDLANLPSRYFNPGELAVLLHLFESANARVVVEFGVNTGRNALATLRNLPDVQQYIGVDVDPSYRSTLLPVQRGEIPERPGELARGDPRFLLIVRPNGTFGTSTYDFPADVDAVFIDADHSRSGVEHDRALALDMVRSGGLIIYHDDNCLPVVEVTQTLNDFCDAGADIRHIAGTWLAYEVVP